MSRSAISRLVVALLLLAAIAATVLYRDAIDLAALDARLRALGPWAPLGFVIAFALGTLAFLPGAVLALAGGALFGPLWGTVWNLVGATLGATLAFLLARTVAGDWVARRAGGRLERLIEGVDAEGWRFVALVRLVPLFPFNLSNYALGLTRITLVQYVAATFVCMIPGAVAYTWLGHAGREAAAGDEAAIRYGLMGLALIAAAVFLPKLVRRLRGERMPQWIEADELARRLSEPGATFVIDVRGADEFDGPLGHMPEAVNLPLDQLAGRLPELTQDKPVVLVCRTDKRSAAAARMLRAAGFGKVSVLRHGMEGWNKAGLQSTRAA